MRPVKAVFAHGLSLQRQQCRDSDGACTVAKSGYGNSRSRCVHQGLGTSRGIDEITDRSAPPVTFDMYKSRHPGFDGRLSLTQVNYGIGLQRRLIRTVTGRISNLTERRQTMNGQLGSPLKGGIAWLAGLDLASAFADERTNPQKRQRCDL